MLDIDGATLRYDAPNGVLTPTLLDAMRHHKAQLVTLVGDCEAPRSVLPLALDQTAPDATYTFTNPQTGQRFVTSLYRCPRCHGTQWGPQIDDPGVWHCLTCAAQEPKDQAESPPTCSTCGRPEWVSHTQYDQVCAFLASRHQQGGEG
jgi:hypothetical protein